MVRDRSRYQRDTGASRRRDPRRQPPHTITDNVRGIHHVTAIASDPRANAQFYTEVLGVRLVKRTVNFDDTSTYHLYYGDETGTPGTVLTFFPFGGGRQGRPGRGQATATAFVVPEGSLDYWADRLETEGLDVGAPTERFGETVLPFADPDGQPLELVESESESTPGATARSRTSTRSAASTA